MKNKSRVIIFILVLMIGYLLYDKITTKPKTVYIEQKQTVSSEAVPAEVAKNVNRECLLSAESFFETKRSQDLELYSATWNEYYDESSGTCYVQIQGNIYDVKTGELITTRQTVR